MALTIRVELLRGVFEAAGWEDEASAEWPPHPARLFCGLVAAAQDPTERDALRWIERQPPPIVLASYDWQESAGRASYVPTNQLKKRSAYQHFPAREAKGPRTWRHVTPRTAVVGYHWDAEPDPATLSNARSLVARLGYLGRSSSPVVADVVESLDAIGHVERWRPTEAADDSAFGIRLLTTPRPGYLDALTERFEADELPWTVPRHVVPYVPDQETHGEPPVNATSYRELIVLPFVDRRISSAFTMLVTSTLRRALEAHLDGGPIVLRGRGRGEHGPRHQIMFLGLPFVGSPYASGDLLGVAVALPSEIGADDRRAVLGALARTTSLTLGRLGTAQLDHGVSSKATLRPSTWTRPARTWITATPISSDRHHRELTEEVLAEDVRRACRHTDLPEPVAVDVSRIPLLPGAQSLRPNLRIRHPGDRATASIHARVQFESPLRGPIALGNLRHYGLGLLRPVHDG